MKRTAISDQPCRAAWLIRNRGSLHLGALRESRGSAHCGRSDGGPMLQLAVCAIRLAMLATDMTAKIGVIAATNSIQQRSFKLDDRRRGFRHAPLLHCILALTE